MHAENAWEVQYLSGITPGKCGATYWTKTVWSDEELPGDYAEVYVPFGFMQSGDAQKGEELLQVVMKNQHLSWLKGFLGSVGIIGLHRFVSITFMVANGNSTLTTLEQRVRRGSRWFVVSAAGDSLAELQPQLHDAAAEGIQAENMCRYLWQLLKTFQKVDPQTGEKRFSDDGPQFVVNVEDHPNPKHGSQITILYLVQFPKEEAPQANEGLYGETGFPHLGYTCAHVQIADAEEAYNDRW